MWHFHFIIQVLLERLDSNSIWSQRQPPPRATTGFNSPRKKLNKIVKIHDKTLNIMLIESDTLWRFHLRQVCTWTSNTIFCVYFSGTLARIFHPCQEAQMLWLSQSAETHNCWNTRLLKHTIAEIHKCPNTQSFETHKCWNTQYIKLRRTLGRWQNWPILGTII